MSMTKKDYELIAQCFKYSLTVEREMLFNDSPSASKDSIDSIKTLARYLAIKLWHDNNKFDQTRFLKACGIEV